MIRQSVSEPSAPAAAFAASEGSARAAARDRKRPRLIVNADDFGASEEVNEAVIRAHKEGVLTSASLMVTGAAFDGAVRLARETPSLAVGIHLVTVVGRAVLSPGEIPSLVDGRGNFPDDPTAAGLKYFFAPQARRELRREVAAQFDRFHSTGLRLSHIDGHLHLHVHPVVFNAALRLGIKYGARRMRVPDEERRLALGFDRGDVLRKTAHALLFGGLSRYMKRKLNSHGFTFPDRVYGNLQSGKMSEQYFLYALDNLSAATNEIYFHPAVYPAHRPLAADERQHSLEFQALTSDRVKERLDELGVRLSNYFDLEANR